MWVLLGLLLWTFLCGTILVSASYVVSLDDKPPRN